jgi:putative tryptophan/tyrosine transport system substrate-binding protein
VKLVKTPVPSVLGFDTQAGEAILRRRQFITLLGGAAAAWPLTARAQGERRRRVAVMMNLPQGDPEAEHASRALVTKLRELGWTEGRNVDFDFRPVGDQIGAFPEIIKQIAQLKPDVIVGRGGSVALALQRDAGTIPVVFVQVIDPIGEGLVQTLARPGGNITGFMNFDPSMGTKWLEIAKEAAPSISRVAVLLYPQEGLERTFKAIEDAASSFGVQATALRVHDAAQIEREIDSFAANGSGAGLIVLPHSVTNSNRDLIASMALRYRLPTVCAYRFYIEAGGLISYGIDEIEPFRSAAIYVDRILRGAKPADLPVQAPTTFKLVVSLKAAKAIGLVLPPLLLTRADEVIE